MAAKTTTPKHEPEVEGKKRTVSIIRDSLVDFPELYCEVYVPAGSEFAFSEMFARARCWLQKDPKKADVVVFTGGPDVNPELYNQKRRHPKTATNDERDKQDIALYKLCLEEGIPMLGICRGAQFLHVMNGGSLYQDVDSHTGDHNIRIMRENRVIERVSSTHHQMCMPHANMEVLAVSYRSTTRHIDDRDSEKGIQRGGDIEAFMYQDTCCLGIQGHPEYKGYPYFTDWVLKQVRDKLIGHPHVKPVNRVYRLQKTVEITDDNN